MGQSPKEQAAASQYSNMNSIAQRFLSGDLSGSNMFKQVNPYFEQGRSDIQTGVQGAESKLNSALSTRMAGIGQQVGESLISSGVPQGQGRGMSFAAAMSPAIAGTQEQIAGMEKFGAQSLADLSRYQGTTLAGLMENSNQMGIGASGQAGSAINNMKDSTTMGDIMGGATSLAQLAAIFTNPELGGMGLLQKLLGGGQGPTASIASSGVSNIQNDVLQNMGTPQYDTGIDINQLIASLQGLGAH
jgi:hypothetical protein